MASFTPYLIPIKLHEVNSENPFEDSEFININNTKIHYRTKTPDNIDIAGKVLMIHGLGGSTYSWRNNVEILKTNGYLVVTADLPGFGYSDKNIGINHSQKNRSVLLWALVEHVDQSLPNKFKSMDWILVGHSMGGGTVAAMTLEKPDKTEKIVLVSGALFDNSPPLVSNIFYYPPIKRAIDVAFSNYIINYKRIESFLKSAYGRQPTSDEVENHLIPLKITKAPSFIPDLLLTSKNESVDKLNSNEVPILYIAGENDSWIPKNDQVKFKSKVNRVELKTIKGAHHSSMETNFDKFNEILLSFIKSDR